MFFCILPRLPESFFLPDSWVRNQAGKQRNQACFPHSGPTDDVTEAVNFSPGGGAGVYFLGEYLVGAESLEGIICKML